MSSKKNAGGGATSRHFLRPIVETINENRFHMATEETDTRAFLEAVNANSGLIYKVCYM